MGNRTGAQRSRKAAGGAQVRCGACRPIRRSGAGRQQAAAAACARAASVQNVRSEYTARTRIVFSKEAGAGRGHAREKKYPPQQRITNQQPSMRVRRTKFQRPSQLVGEWFMCVVESEREKNAEDPRGTAIHKKKVGGRQVVKV